MVHLREFGVHCSVSVGLLLSMCAAWLVDGRTSKGQLLGWRKPAKCAGWGGCRTARCERSWAAWQVFWACNKRLCTPE